MKCQVRDLQVHYEVRGEGRPIVFLHGALLPYFERIFAARSGWQRLYVDYPGIRQTAVPEWVQSSDDILAVVNELIEQILGTDGFVLVGFSYASYLARGILQKRFPKIEGIALICPVVHADFACRTIPEDQVVFEATEELAQFSEADRRELEGYVVQNHAVWQRIRQYQDEGSDKMDRAFFNQLKKAGRYAFGFNPDVLEKQFQKPALIIAGRQDYVVGYADSLQLLQNYPRATYAILDQAGHMLMVEQEELFASLVEQWLTRLGE